MDNLGFPRRKQKLNWNKTAFFKILCLVFQATGTATNSKGEIQIIHPTGALQPSVFSRSPFLRMERRR